MRPLARLNHFFWTYKHLFIPGLIFTMISAGFQITVPMVVRQAIDGIPQFVRLHGMMGGTFAAGTVGQYFLIGLLVFAAAIIALTLISGVFKFLMRQTIVVASRHIEYDLRNDLYEHLQKLSPAFYQDYSTGDVITRATDDIDKVRRYIGPAIMYITRSLAMVLVGTALVVGAAYATFDLRLPQQPFAAGAAVVLGCLSFFAAGAMLGGVLPTTRTAQAVGMALFFPMLFLSGAAMPRRLFPELLQQISLYLPLTHVVLLIQDLWMGPGWNLMAALVLVGLLAASAALATRWFRWT